MWRALNLNGRRFKSPPRSIEADQFPLREHANLGAVEVLLADVRVLPGALAPETVDTPELRANSVKGGTLSSDAHRESDPFGGANENANDGRAVGKDHTKTRAIRYYHVPDNEWGAGDREPPDRRLVAGHRARPLSRFAEEPRAGDSRHPYDAFVSTYFDVNQEAADGRLEEGGKAILVDKPLHHADILTFLEDGGNFVKAEKWLHSGRAFSATRICTATRWAPPRG